MKKFNTLILLCMICVSAYSQKEKDSSTYDITALLNDVPPSKQKVVATFKTTRIINMQSNETVHKRTLDFRVAHRFGAVGKKSEGNSHNFYGFDNSTDIRIAFEYGISDALTIGLSRSKKEENLEGLIKYRLLQQTTDNKIPVAITLFGSLAYTPKHDPAGLFKKSDDSNPALNQQLRRITYVTQAIIARKFSSSLSLVLVPTIVHRNFIVNPSDENTIFALGGAGRFKFTKSMAFIVDYVYNFSDFRKIDNNNSLYNPLGAGIEIETGGHVFSMMWTNAAGIIESEFIPNTIDTWTKAGFRFSFNISRNFRL